MEAATPHELLTIPLAAFEARWDGMGFEEKRALGVEVYQRCLARSQELLDYQKTKIQQATRKYGEPDHEAQPDHELLHETGNEGRNGHDHPDLMRKTTSNLIDWAALAHKEPPPFVWLWDHWLSWHPTGMWGRGGVGKSLLAQQLETALATAKPLWGSTAQPVTVLAWHCEDDHDELWRRQDRICRRMNIGFDALTNLHIDARCGLENALFTTEYGRPMWTPLYRELQEQVNDLKVDVLFLDNINQLFGGDINNAHHVTTFVNGVDGLVRERPFCPVLLGHVAKAQGSEFAGNMAWENAVRMRWYFTKKLPNETDADPVDSGADESDTRFLCKQKTNYSREDYVQFHYDQGIFVVKNEPATDDGGTLEYLRKQRARSIVLQAVKKLADLGIFCHERPGIGFLPLKILEMKLSDGFTKAELRAAMNGLISDKELVIAEVGRNSNRTAKFGLKLAAQT